MPLPIDCDFARDETLRCKGKENTDKADSEGEYFGNMAINDRLWAVVLWDGDEDPDLYKADCLLVQKKRWERIN